MSSQNTDEKPFGKATVLVGSSDSHFGQSLTNRKDANLDGFEELIIGAPSIGQVFIFNGGRTVSKTATQVSEIESFGLAVSGGQDFDKNGHPDLLVGGKDAIVAIPTRPVISISSLISLTDIDGEEIQSISLEGKK